VSYTYLISRIKPSVSLVNTEINNVIVSMKIVSSTSSQKHLFSISKLIVTMTFNTKRNDIIDTDKWHARKNIERVLKGLIT
jgi:hypothetical protein